MVYGTSVEVYGLFVLNILWDIDNRKAEDMCNRCFWIKEVGLFLRDFKASTGHPNFETWR